jgi:A1 cistron-splicing factor AAR2
MPKAAQMQCDLYAWAVGPKFKGIKMVPPGLHFLSWSAGEDKVGVFLSLPSAHVEVWRWNDELEDLEPVTGDEQPRLVHGVKEFQFDGEMGAYPQDIGEGWLRLTYLINEEVLKRCGIPCGTKVSPVAAGSTDREKFPDAPVPAVFSPINEMRRREGMTASEISRYNLDGSERVSELVSQHFDGEWKGFLGELQLAFVLFVFMSSLEAFEHWKRGVALLCICGDAMADSRAEMMSEFVRALRRQLEHVPADFFEEELSAENFLRPCLAALFELADFDADGEPGLAGPAPPAAPPSAQDPDAAAAARRLLRRRLRRLREFSHKRFGLSPAAPAALSAHDAMARLSMGADAADAADDDGPVVVAPPVDPRPASPPALSAVTSAPAAQPAQAARGEPMDAAAAPPARMAWMLPPAPAPAPATA